MAADPELQAMYESLKGRGVLSGDAEMSAMAASLVDRGLINDRPKVLAPGVSKITLPSSGLTPSPPGTKKQIPLPPVQLSPMERLAHGVDVGMEVANRWHGATNAFANKLTEGMHFATPEEIRAMQKNPPPPTTPQDVINNVVSAPGKAWQKLNEA